MDEPDVHAILNLIALQQREILAELQAVHAAIKADRDPRTVRHADRAAIAEILPVLAAHFSGTFETWELIDASERPDALGANLQLVLKGRTSQQLGKLFQRVAGHQVDGFLLRRAGAAGDVARWECTGSSSPYAAPAPQNKLLASFSQKKKGSR